MKRLTIEIDGLGVKDLLEAMEEIKYQVENDIVAGGKNHALLPEDSPSRKNGNYIFSVRTLSTEVEDDT